MVEIIIVAMICTTIGYCVRVITLASRDKDGDYLRHKERLLEHERKMLE